MMGSASSRPGRTGRTGRTAQAFSSLDAEDVIVDLLDPRSYKWGGGGIFVVHGGSAEKPWSLLRLLAKTAAASCQAKASRGLSRGRPSLPGNLYNRKRTKDVHMTGRCRRYIDHTGLGEAADPLFVTQNEKAAQHKRRRILLFLRNMLSTNQSLY